MKKETKNAVKNTALVLSGVGVGVCLVGFLYDNLRKDYNKLVDKSNNLVDFIHNHDFYEKEETKASYVPQKTTEQTQKKTNLVLLEDFYDEELKVHRRIYQDTNTGFKIYC